MQSYCIQDSDVTWALWNHCLKRCEQWGIDPLDPNPPPGKDCIQLEHDVAAIIDRQERTGFAFNESKAMKLYGQLSAERAGIEQVLENAFPPLVHTTTRVMKASNKKLGYVKGQPFTKTVVVPFNPGSRKQIAARLKALGWEPEEFTKDGSPKVDDAILESLPYPEAKPLARYFLLTKLMAYIADGKGAWLTLAKRGRIHGRVNPNGAITGRMAHFQPNYNIPSCASPFGKECRELFESSMGKLVGIDADALELRGLAHFLAKHDGGAYIQTVLEGKKEEGTDMHTLNCIALGMDPKKRFETGETGRDRAKTWFYAFIYGAGDWKLGFTLTGKRGPKNKIAAAGKQGKLSFLTKLPAFGVLVKSIASRLSKSRYIRGLDGRLVKVLADHAALNSVIQSSGAVLMKRALVILDAELKSLGLTYAYNANVHDEWQIDTPDDETAHLVGKTGTEAITKAGEFYNFRCPLKGNYEVGRNWAETH